MILASASPRRLELLRDLGFEPRVRPADIDESRREGEAPTELVDRLAREKARAASAALLSDPDELLLAADTIVWGAEGDVFGKPADAEDARRMLARLSGRTHHVSTGVCIMLARGAGELRETSFVETTEVSFQELTDGEIAAYVASGEPLDKAGAYGIQGVGRLLVRGISGDYLNVVGLPVSRTVREMASLCDLQGEGRLVERLLSSALV